MRDLFKFRHADILRHMVMNILCQHLNLSVAAVLLRIRSVQAFQHAAQHSAQQTVDLRASQKVRFRAKRQQPPERLLHFSDGAQANRRQAIQQGRRVSLQTRSVKMHKEEFPFVSVAGIVLLKRIAINDYSRPGRQAAHLFFPVHHALSGAGIQKKRGHFAIPSCEIARIRMIMPDFRGIQRE